MVFVIKPGRGLRQGCPLSPYLFLLVSETLSRSLSLAVLEGRLSGLSALRGGPVVSHLFFADDSLLFTKATVGEIDSLRGIISDYEVASGQLLNLQKSSVVFSDNVSDEMKAQYSQRLGVQLVAEHETYLGLPTTVGRNRSTTFAYIPERVVKKLKGWKGKELSAAGKEILIKTVVQSIPNFAMSCFLLPLKVCNEIEQLIRKFWWGGDVDTRKMHWVAWDILKMSKEDGGIGFRDFHDFNIAMLAKQTWRFLSKPNILVHRVFRDKYFRNSSILDFVLTPNSQISYAFRSILAGRDLVVSGLDWKVGDGRRIIIYKDRWISRENTCKVYTFSAEGDEDLTVDYLIDEAARTWNEERLEQCLSPMDIEEVRRISIPATPRLDSFFWHHTDDGVYSVSSGYMAQVIRSRGEASSSTGHVNRKWLAGLWKLKIPKKFIFPVWRTWNSSLPVASHLNQRGIEVSPLCGVCNSSLESEENLFITCEFATRIWATMEGFDFIINWKLSLRELIFSVFNSKPMHIRELFTATIWTMWKGQNSARFEGKSSTMDAVCAAASGQVAWFQEAARYGRLEDTQPAVEGVAGHWPRPATGFTAISSDAAWRQFGPATGVGVAARDSEGRFITRRHRQIHHLRTPLLAELAGIDSAISLALELQLSLVSIQTDSAGAIQLIRNGICGKVKVNDALSELSELVHLCRSKLALFSSSSLCFIGRSGNCLAHVFTTKGLEEEDMFYYSQAPSWASDVIALDSLGETAQFL